jgi:NAD(P)-dependent dehydrogenase (short-subunit alcohol dehydrogenase family)
MTAAFQTNATGPAVVVEAFVPLLKKSRDMGNTPRIVNVTSGAGSIGLRSDRSNPHQAMKFVRLSFPFFLPASSLSWCLCKEELAARWRDDY